jgi:hypothetical protein
VRAIRSLIPVVPSVLAFVGVAAFYAAFISFRIDEHGLMWFVHLGREFVTASTRSTVITRSLGWHDRVGYDGQYYFFLAADPIHARYYMPDRAGIIYSRILYPAVSRALGLGSVRVIPYAMLTVNLLAVGAGTLAVAVWLRVRGASSWAAALFAIFPGMIFSVFRDLTEPLAFALAALAVLAFEVDKPRRLVVSAALFALAALTRETVLPFALAAAAGLVVADSRHAHRCWSARTWRRGLFFASAACVPLLAWRILVSAYVHEPTQEAAGSGWLIPFHGFLSYRFDAQHRLILLTIITPALAAGIGALVLLRRRGARVQAGLLLVNILLFVVFLPASVAVNYPAVSRSAVGVVLATIYCTPAWRTCKRWRAPVFGGAFAWSIGWFLLVAEHYEISGIRVIT